MIAFRKLSVVLLFIFAAGTTVNAQRRGDLGILFSSDELSRIGLAYRMPIGDRYRLRAGFHFLNSTFYYRDNIFLATDSVVIYSRNTRYRDQYTLRLGAERQFSSSVFSVGADLVLGYLSVMNSDYSIAQKQDEGGNWRYDYSYLLEDSISNSFNLPNPIFYRKHSLLAGLRLSLDANLPLGNAFLLHVSLSGALMGDIYMMAEGDVPGNLLVTDAFSLTYLFFDAAANIGVRYKFGSLKGKWKNRKREDVRIKSGNLWSLF